LSGTLAHASDAGVFTRGSTLRHVLVMTAAGSVGLMAIFVVDLLNLFYISLLGEQELAAAVGYAGTVLFFLTSVSIGVAIAITALVSRALGARDRERARRLAASGLVFMALASTALSAAFLALAGPLLDLLGAGGRTHALAARFLWITLPFTPLLGLGMAFGGILRAVGDARRAMWVTLAGGVAAAIADPLLIFGFGLALDGAAVATNLARFVVALVGYHGASRIHDLVARPSLAATLDDARALGAIALPAVVTNVATPVANAYVTAALAPYGDSAVAAWAVIGRLVPVAFGAVFALSGALGPILGQNQGAKDFERVRRALTDALGCSVLYVLAVWGLLALAQDAVVAAFAASGPAAALIRFYCSFVAGTFVFTGVLFVANAAFNTLGAPLLATAFNWARATLGTAPFTLVGGAWFGAEGVLLGQGLGGVPFGIGAILAAYGLIARLRRREDGPS
jgi:putative MATE family efflux protein